MDSFVEILVKGNRGDPAALQELLEMYKPLLLSKSKDENGRFVADLYQEQCAILLKCVKKFDFQEKS